MVKELGKMPRNFGRRGRSDHAFAKAVMAAETRPKRLFTKTQVRAKL